MPIRMTVVRPVAATADRSWMTWPLMTTKPVLTPRCVTGMPAAAGAAMALVMPGTTSTGMPASRHASTSSEPRPSTKGSPPFSRATRRPRLARSTMTALISSCVSTC